MSRSRRQQCSQGRGCGVCGDAGEVRRTREAEHARRDDLTPLDPPWLDEVGYPCGPDCSFCDPHIPEWRARTGDRPLPTTLADAVLARCGLRVR